MPHLAEIPIPGIIASGIENIRIDPIGGRFSTRQLTRKSVAQADLPIQGESSDRSIRTPSSRKSVRLPGGQDELPSHTSRKDVIYAIDNEVVINGDMVAWRVDCVLKGLPSQMRIMKKYFICKIQIVNMLQPGIW